MDIIQVSECIFTKFFPWAASERYLMI